MESDLFSYLHCSYSSHTLSHSSSLSRFLWFSSSPYSPHGNQNDPVEATKDHGIPLLKSQQRLPIPLRIKAEITTMTPPNPLSLYSVTLTVPYADLATPTTLLLPKSCPVVFALVIPSSEKTLFLGICLANTSISSNSLFQPSQWAQTHHLLKNCKTALHLQSPLPSNILIY